jgi:hypothetical protein
VRYIYIAKAFSHNPLWRFNILSFFWRTSGAHRSILVRQTGSNNGRKYISISYDIYTDMGEKSYNKSDNTFSVFEKENGKLSALAYLRALATVLRGSSAKEKI